MAKDFLHSAYQSYYPQIEPMKKVVPDWYREMDRFVGGSLEVFPNSTKTAKTCVPFLDSLTVGYCIPLAFDVLVSFTEDGALSTTWSTTDASPVVHRESKYASTLPVPHGHLPYHLAWFVQHVIKLPKGYSALVTHPFNRFDLPFTTLSGIVDVDWAMYGGVLPFFLKEGFTGVIPAGTPIAQVIPFKLENWKSQLDTSLIKEAENNQRESRTKVLGWYKSKHWRKKDFS